MKILLGTGRGTIRRMVEGYVLVFKKVLVSEVRNTGLCPSTTFGRPPPPSEED